MGKITVYLDKVINLVDTDLIGKADPYVVLHLEQDNLVFDKNYGKKTSKKIKGANNPVYNETFVWDNVKSLNNLVYVYSVYSILVNVPLTIIVWDIVLVRALSTTFQRLLRSLSPETKRYPHTHSFLSLSLSLFVVCLVAVVVVVVVIATKPISSCWYCSLLVMIQLLFLFLDSIVCGSKFGMMILVWMIKWEVARLVWKNWVLRPLLLVRTVSLITI
jgi:hypothetical protein